jgi:hypothetical protein
VLMVPDDAGAPQTEENRCGAVVAEREIVELGQQRQILGAQRERHAHAARAVDVGVVRLVGIGRPGDRRLALGARRLGGRLGDDLLVGRLDPEVLVARTACRPPVGLPPVRRAPRPPAPPRAWRAISDRTSSPSSNSLASSERRRRMPVSIAVPTQIRIIERICSGTLANSRALMIARIARISR